MKKFLCLILAGISAVVSADGVIKTSPKMNQIRVNIPKGKAGRIQKEAADEKYPNGKILILPDTSKPDYRLSVYFHDPAGFHDRKRYTVKFTVSDDIAPGVQMSLGLKTKDRNYNWYGSLRGMQYRKLTVKPGSHQLTNEIDLKQQNLPRLGFICPILYVSGVTSGSVTIESIEVETESSPGKNVSDAVPEGPGLPGFSVRKNALTNFQWKQMSMSHTAMMMEYTTQGLNIVTLKPENAAAAWQWPTGDTILAEYQNRCWRIRSGRQPGKYIESCDIAGDSITAAAGAEGVVFRDAAGKDTFVYGGLNQIGRILLVKDGTPELQVRNLMIAEQAVSWIIDEEAENALNNAEKLYQANLPYMIRNWSGNQRAGQWKSVFDLYRRELNAHKTKLLRETENYLPILMKQRTIRDRFALWVYSAALYYFVPNGTWTNDFFRIMDGQAHIQAILQLAGKVDSLVSRARRVCKASFTEGVAAEKLNLSAGFAESSLTHVFRRAGSPDKILKGMTLDLGAGETESAQLVLTTGRYGIQDLGVKCTPVSDGAPSVKLYLTDYISLMAEPNPQLPLTLGGDVEMPDVLKNYRQGTPFSIESHKNQPVQIDVRSNPDTKPGVYRYKVEVLHKNAAVISLPLTVKVRNFSFGKDHIPNIGGWTHSGFYTWYTDKNDIKTGRRNLITAMLEHRLNPIDLYNTSPIPEDLEWALKQGVTAVNIGRSPLESMAHPDPDMLKFLVVYGSADGKKFVRIPAEMKLAGRPLKFGLEERDLVISLKKSVREYKYLKIHNSEIRDWKYALPIQRYFLLTTQIGDHPAEFTLNSGKTAVCRKFRAIIRDKSPDSGGWEEAREYPEFWLDFRRSGQELRSVILETGNTDLSAIRLINRCIQRSYNEIMAKYKMIRSTPGGEKIPIYLYGYDESREYLNRQVLSSFSHAKKVLPKDIRIVSTVGEPWRKPEIYRYLDIHVPCNGYGFPRNNQRVKEKYGTKFWTYVGGGSYYPFASFERVDQPLIYSRAFCWEMIGFDFIEGMLYWDIHMWRYNKPLKDCHDIDWSLWNPTHNTNNGMGAIFYPGPHGEIYPSRRATALRDGLDDVLAVKIAKRLIAAKPAAGQEELKKRLQKIRDGFCTGMSSYCKSIEQMNSCRKELYDLIEELNR